MPETPGSLAEWGNGNVLQRPEHRLDSGRRLVRPIHSKPMTPYGSEHPMTDQAFDEQVALITGAANGIGAAVARRLSSLGVSLVLCDVDDAAGSALAAELGGVFVHTDVREPEDNASAVARAWDEFGRLDLVHLNAGVTTGTAFGDAFDVEKYRRAMSVNLDGVVFGLQATLPKMLSVGHGQIVATASMAGIVPVPFDPFYGANKSAVVSMVRSLGEAHRDTGVRINALCPSFAETDIIAEIRPFLVETHFPILAVGDVVDAFMGITEGDGTGECWYVVPGRQPEPFRFRNAPGPRDTDRSS